MLTGFHLVSTLLVRQGRAFFRCIIKILCLSSSSLCFLSWSINLFHLSCALHFDLRKVRAEQLSVIGGSRSKNWVVPTIHFIEFLEEVQVRDRAFRLVFFWSYVCFVD